PRVPRLRAEVPVDRYPIWPAQGLSYALGRLEIRRLRAAAQRALGRRFDVKEFHDRVLADGAVPLPLLQENIGRWIAAARWSWSPPGSLRPPPSGGALSASRS